MSLLLAFELVADFMQVVSEDAPAELQLEGAQDMARVSVLMRCNRNAALRRRGLDVHVAAHRAQGALATTHLTHLERQYERISNRALECTIRLMVLERILSQASLTEGTVEERVRELALLRQRDGTVLSRLLERHPELVAESQELRAAFVSEVAAGVAADSAEGSGAEDVEGGRVKRPRACTERSRGLLLGLGV